MQEVVRRSECAARCTRPPAARRPPTRPHATLLFPGTDLAKTVHAQVSRISRNVTTRHKCGGLPSAPILSRVFQEAIERCRRVRASGSSSKYRCAQPRAAAAAAAAAAQPPPPPPAGALRLVHFNAILLLLFNAFCVVIAAFRRSVWMSVVMSVVASAASRRCGSWRTSWRTRSGRTTTCR